VLLGKISFTHAGAAMPPSMDIALGRAAPYDNFVCTDVDKTVMDGSISWGSLAVYERGDVNGNGEISGADLSALKYFMVNGGILHPWIDCNNSGDANGADLSCIKYAMTH